jgi:hypothetical protein
MVSLVPCTVCRRHLRRHETQCHFCGAERTPEPAVREAALARGVKRATLFALGLTNAGQACGTEENAVPIYGAPAVGGSGGGSGNGGVAGNGGGTAGGASTAGGGGGGQVQPVYGAPVSPDGGAGGALPPSPVDAGTDSGAADSGSDAGN